MGSLDHEFGNINILDHEIWKCRHFRLRF